MLLFVGLGNPGSNHAGNRHNIGFMAVQAIARRHELSPWRRRFQGVAVEGNIATERVLLLLPGTYMNESGRAVAEAVNFYKLEPGHVVVFHDEVELPPAKVRLKLGGDKDLMERYVLQDFAKDEWPWVEALCEIVADNVGLLIEGKDSTFLNRVHLAMSAKGFGQADEPSDPAQ